MNNDVVDPPRLRLALMVDHFDVTHGGKLMLIGIFDQFFAQRPLPPKDRIEVGVGFLVIQVEASLAFGSNHSLQVECLDDDEKDVAALPAQHIEFSSTGEGLPLRATFVMQLGRLLFPDFGHYQWHVRVDGESVGRCPFAVVEAAS